MNSTSHGLLGQSHLIAGEDPQEFSKFEEGIRADLKPVGVMEEYFADLFTKCAWRLNRFDNVESALLVNKESPDDLSFADLMTIIESLNRMGLQSFDRTPEMKEHLLGGEPKNNRDAQATPKNNSEDGSTRDIELAFAVRFLAAAVDLSAAEGVFIKNFVDRLVRMSLGTNKPQSSQTPAEADRAQGERGAPSSEDAINRIARTFSRRREVLALLLRYRTQIRGLRDNALHELERRQAARQGQLVPAPEVVDVNVNFTGKDEDRN